MIDKFWCVFMPHSVVTTWLRLNRQ